METEDVPQEASRTGGVRRLGLGPYIRARRRDLGLSGQALGSLVDVSQSKISKIEGGHLVPTTREVERIGSALQLSSDIISNLVGEADALRASPVEPRRGVVGQQDYYKEEGRARLIRTFEPLIVPGLLQMSEYTRAILNGYYRVEKGAPEGNFPDIAATVSLRAQRQERLYDTSKEFDFVIMEGVLRHRFARSEYMVAQVERIESAAKLENVTVRIVPDTADLVYPPTGGFVIFDGQTVLAESMDAQILRDQQSIEFYKKFFDAYADVAEVDLERILAKYKARYKE